MADDRNKVGSTEDNYPVLPRPTETEDNLVDDKISSGPEFRGATLELDSTRQNMNSEVKFAGLKEGQAKVNGESGIGPIVDHVDGGFDRTNRPGSTISRKSVTSTGSRASLSATRKESTYTAEMYFSKKHGLFETAVENCRETALKSDLDGDIRGAWLLTEIDHWDNEREKVVILCDSSLLFLNFDFITQKMKSFQRIMLHIINEIYLGDFVYPDKSLMKPRDHGGVRICWGDSTNLSFGQKWNPFCSDIPFISFTHHPLIYNQEDKETVTFNVDDFYESLITSVQNAYKSKNPGKAVTLIEAPILIETYANLGSMIYNQSHLGFNRDRGGVCF